MKIWILEKGKKQGPFEEYQLRGRIQDGELKSDTPAWHEGMVDWGSLGDITVLATEFEELDRKEVEELFQPPELDPDAEDTPLKVHQPYQGLWRRFVARWLEVTVYQALLLSVFSLGGKDLYDFIDNGSFLVFHLVPLLLLEVWMLCRWGTTPGKLLMKLKVSTMEGVPFSYPRALLRTLLVWFLGLGVWLPNLLLLGHAVGMFCVRKFGAPLWDFRSNQYVEKTGKVNGRSWFAAAFLMVASFILQMNLLAEPLARFAEANKEMFTMEQRASIKEFSEGFK